MNVIDQYPSTLDMPRIRGGQDAVLAILKGARKRYKRGATSDAYIGSGGVVCAVGAVGREAGIKPSQWDHISGDGELSFTVDFNKVMKMANVEAEVRKAAKQAITLLNNSAKRLYGDTGVGWSSPLERINQQEDWHEAKQMVLRCYDDAIERRQAKVAA